MQLQAQAESLFRKTFGGEPTAIARAPGRIEFIGNHTDYNLGTVLGASIDRGIAVAARLRTDRTFVFASETSPEPWTVRGLPLARQTGAGTWTNYPLGMIVALEARGLPPPEGLEVAVVSDLPVGAGLSSSAALEMSSGLAFSALRNFSLSTLDMVKAGREAENRFVGVPCGILDQGVSGFGKRNHLVHIDCRGPVMSLVPMPAGVRFWIFNTHHKHALVDSLYATRHAECMEAAKILHARHAQIEALADATPAQVLAAADVLAPAVLKRARHIVDEIARVSEMRVALAAGDLAAAGRLLFASHESSRVLFENSTPELDSIVDALRGRAGVFGARLTGGGFGGAVMAMTSESFDAAAAQSVATAFAAKHGSKLDVLTCATGDGAELLAR